MHEIGELTYSQMIQKSFLEKLKSLKFLEALVHLKPIEVSLTRTWYQLGIPVDVVIGAIDRCFEGKTAPRIPLYLKDCQCFVDEDYQHWLKSQSSS